MKKINKLLILLSLTLIPLCVGAQELSKSGNDWLLVNSNTSGKLLLGTTGAKDINIIADQGSTPVGWSIDGTTGALSGIAGTESVTLGSGGLLLPNATALQAEEADGTDANLIQMLASDDIQIGQDGGLDDLLIRITDDIHFVQGGGTRFSFTAEGDIIAYGTTPEINTGTTDASDSSDLCFTGGGACSTSRGGHIIAYGNENASDGDVLIRAGNASGSEVYIQTSASGGNIQFAAGTGSSRDLLITQNLVDFETDSGNNLGIPRGTDLPDSPAAGYLFLDTNDGACDDANDSGGTAVCLYSGAAWILLGNTGS